MLLFSARGLVEGLMEKTRRLGHLLLAFACLPLSVHYTLPPNTYPTLHAA